MNKIQIAERKLDSFLERKAGIGLLDLPDSTMFSDWIDDDMTEKEIDLIIPDLAWEILDDSGMDRDTVDKLCYPEEYEDE